MTENELETLLEWRLKRGYKGLGIRNDDKAWVVNYGPSEARTSRNFSFNSEYDLQVLWQLDEACMFLEQACFKSNYNLKMFGLTRVSRVRKNITDGNDLEGVFLERHANGLIRLQFQLHMPPSRFKYTIPKKMHNNEMYISWCLAFGRQIRALCFDAKNNDLTRKKIDAAWLDFLTLLKDEHYPHGGKR